MKNILHILAAIGIALVAVVSPGLAEQLAGIRSEA
jgi:hypothetical protein